MERTKEPELMQDVSQAKAYAKADFDLSDDALVRRLEKFLLSKGKSLDAAISILDLGCGPGNISEKLALMFPNASVIGLDGSEAMLAIARERKTNQVKQGKLENLNYKFFNITSFVNDDLDSYISGDVVVSNSLIHHVHNPTIFWKAAKKLSIPGSIHLHRDLRRPKSLKVVYELQNLYLPDAEPVLINDYIASLKAAFTAKEVKEQLFNEGLDKLHVFEIMDRYLEVIGIY